MIKAGNRIKCIDNFQAENFLVLGKVYIVFDVYWDSETVMLQELRGQVWFWDRFEIVETAIGFKLDDEES